VAFAEIAALGLSPDTPKVRQFVEAGSSGRRSARLRATAPAAWCWTG
jgi:hypothetical protein